MLSSERIEEQEGAEEATSSMFKSNVDWTTRLNGSFASTTTTTTTIAAAAASSPHVCWVAAHVFDDFKSQDAC